MVKALHTKGAEHPLVSAYYESCLQLRTATRLDLIYKTEVQIESIPVRHHSVIAMELAKQFAMAANALSSMLLDKWFKKQAKSSLLKLSVHFLIGKGSFILPAGVQDDAEDTLMLDVYQSYIRKEIS